MPLWLIALVFLLGFAWIVFYSVSKITRSIQSLTDSLESLIEPTSDAQQQLVLQHDLTPRLTLGNRLADLAGAMPPLEYKLEQIHDLLLPIATLAASRFEKIGWDRFLQLRRKMDKTIEESQQQKHHRKIMRDEHGAPVMVYEDEIEAALQKGWTRE